MRKEYSYYFEASIDQVYRAYLSAAVNKPFERSCKQMPVHTITFGVSGGFNKYNMNGGACNIHLMPCGSGTAVIIRFSIAQLAFAKCETYAQDLNRAMQVFLPVVPRPAKYNMEDFLKPENQVTPEMLRNTPAPAAPAAPAAPVTPAAPAAPAAPVAPAGNICSACGKALPPDARFCPACGTPAAPEKKLCPKCRAEAPSGAAFCIKCGTRL